MASTAFMLEESDLKLNTARRFQRSEFFYNPDKLEMVGGGDGFRLHYILKTNQDNLSRLPASGSDLLGPLGRRLGMVNLRWR